MLVKLTGRADDANRVDYLVNALERDPGGLGDLAAREARLGGSADRIVAGDRGALKRASPPPDGSQQDTIAAGHRRSLPCLTDRPASRRVAS